MNRRVPATFERGLGRIHAVNKDDVTGPPVTWNDAVPVEGALSMVNTVDAPVEFLSGRIAAAFSNCLAQRRSVAPASLPAVRVIVSVAIVL